MNLAVAPGICVLNLSRPEATFTLSYRLTDCVVINEFNLLKIHGNVLKVLLTYYRKQVHVLLNILTKKILVMLFLLNVYAKLNV
jgi:hypothetical protein